MGIYPDHGIEYHVILKNNKRIVIAGIKDTDERLRVSKYLDARYEKWMDLCQSRCMPLKDAHELDVELTSDEKDKLAKVLETTEYITHGWQDVCNLHDTYGDPVQYYDSKETSGYYVILRNQKKIKVSANANLTDQDLGILKSIQQVYENDIERHGWLAISS